MHGEKKKHLNFNFELYLALQIQELTYINHVSS